jgi:hypothetical protein
MESKVSGLEKELLETKVMPGVVMHGYNPSTWELKRPKLEASTGYIVRPCLK